MEACIPLFWLKMLSESQGILDSKIVEMSSLFLQHNVCCIIINSNVFVHLGHGIVHRAYTLVFLKFGASIGVYVSPCEESQKE